MKVPNLPEQLIHIILSYDGRIKYKNGKYVNIIHKHDERYNIIYPIISKKIKIIKSIKEFYGGKGFYLEFSFDKQPMLWLTYWYNNNNNSNYFEICYTDMKPSGNVIGASHFRTIYN